MDCATVTGIDQPVSRIVFGTDRLQVRHLPWQPRRGSEQQAFSLLDRSFELGCNAFDTARIYGDSERTLGAWIRGSRNRDDVVVISKGCHPNRLGRPRLSASEVSHDLHASLAAIGTDYIDLYLLHYDAPGVRIEPLLERLNRHIEEGKIRAIGVSNWSHERVASANACAAITGVKPFSASSVQFSLADWARVPWRGAVTVSGGSQRPAREWYRSHPLSVFAYSSLGRGFFSEHYDPQNPGRNRISRWCATYFGTEENIQRLQRAKTFALKHHVTVAQVALAFVLCHSLHAFAVVGCTTSDKFEQNVDALSLKLDEATLHWLDTGQVSP